MAIKYYNTILNYFDKKKQLHGILIILCYNSVMFNFIS